MALSTKLRYLVCCDTLGHVDLCLLDQNKIKTPASKRMPLGPVGNLIKSFRLILGSFDFRKL